MFVKALWFKEYKQVQALLWLIFAVLFAVLPLDVIHKLNTIRDQLARGGDFSPDGPQLVYGGNMTVLAFLVIVLGCLQIGAERSRNQDNFTFSLPYPLGTIYMTKWAVGALTILVSVAVNSLIAHVLVQTAPFRSQLSVYPDLLQFGLVLFFSALALYTLTLFLGTLSGGVVYQAMFSFIFSVFPEGFMALVTQSAHIFMQIFFMSDLDISTNWWAQLAFLIYHASLFLQVSSASTALSPEMLTSAPAPEKLGQILTIDLLYIAIFLLWGIFLYRRNKLEYNGRMVIFPGMRRFFLTGITVCFAMLGGSIATAGGGYEVSLFDLFLYLAGALIMGGLAYWFTLRLLKMPRRLRITQKISSAERGLRE